MGKITRATGWVLENRTLPELRYWTGKDVQCSPNHMDAVRFCRKEDAERVKAGHPYGSMFVVVEHVWISE